MRGWERQREKEKKARAKDLYNHLKTTKLPTNAKENFFLGNQKNKKILGNQKNKKKKKNGIR